MQTENLVLVTEFCIHYHAEISFVHSLSESGLIETVVQEENVFIYADDLPQLEKMTRLHYDLDINIEGLEAIAHLLETMHSLDNKLAAAQRRLKLYENND